MRQLLAISVLVLVPVALVAIAGGVVCLLLGEHAPAGPAASALIAHERDRRAGYYPDPVLLTDRGRRLHRFGRRLLWAGAGAFAAAFVSYVVAVRA